MDWTAIGTAAGALLVGVAGFLAGVRTLLGHLRKLRAEVRCLRDTTADVKAATDETLTQTNVVKAEVKNSHTTNLRDDVDRLGARFERLGDRVDDQHREVLGHLLVQSEQMKDLGGSVRRHIERRENA